MYVTITELSTDREWTHTARTTDPQTAMARAIARHFGLRASLHRDSSLRHGIYGQIIEPSRQQHAFNCLTGRVRVDVE